MKQTRQAVWAVKQSIFLDVFGYYSSCCAFQMASASVAHLHHGPGGRPVSSRHPPHRNSFGSTSRFPELAPDHRGGGGLSRHRRILPLLLDRRLGDDIINLFFFFAASIPGNRQEVFYCIRNGATTFTIKTPSKWIICDIQHNDIQHNDTKHKGIICDTQHNDIQYNGIQRNKSVLLC